MPNDTRSRDPYEEHESMLNPHRSDEQHAAALETAARLHHRGVRLTGDEGLEELAELLTAVEDFEAAVEAQGGDLMVDDLRSTQPDDPHFVLPQRNEGEPVSRYLARIGEATELVWGHPPLPQ